MLDQSVLSHIFTTFGPLFAIADPVGVVPIFLDYVRPPQKDAYSDFKEYKNQFRIYQKYSRQQALFIAITVFVVLILSLLAGERIFNFFGINLGVLRIAGSLLIFKIGWHMASVNESLVDSQKELLVDIQNESAHRNYTRNLIVPIAIPLISGPGAISLVISQAYVVNEGTAILGSFIAIAVLSLLVWLCLYGSIWITKMLGETGTEALQRIFGFIVLAIALEMLFNGIFGVLQVYVPKLIQLLS